MRAVKKQANIKRWLYQSSSRQFCVCCMYLCLLCLTHVKSSMTTSPAYSYAVLAFLDLKLLALPQPPQITKDFCLKLVILTSQCKLYKEFLQKIMKNFKIFQIFTLQQPKKLMTELYMSNNKCKIVALCGSMPRQHTLGFPQLVVLLPLCYHHPNN